MERKKIISASIYILGGFFLSQLMRLGGNLVVTRLLTPEMFGVMAIINVLMHGLAMFSDLGLRAFIIRSPKALSAKELNTVWTIQVIRGWLMFLGACLIALTFYMVNEIFVLDKSSVYRSSELPYLVVTVGLISIVKGYATLAPAIMDRELRPARLEGVELISQFISLSMMLFLAWKFSSIWALVSAAVTGALVKVFLIYRYFSIRHQLAWDKIVVKKVFNFGKWIFISTVLTYLAMQGDKLIFSVHISATEIGVYSIAFMLSGVIANVLEKLVTKVWLPVLSKIARERPAELKRKYYIVRLRQDMVIFLAIGILIAISPRMIEFLYDERFYSAGWMMQVLLIGVVGQVISRLGIACLTALGKTKIRMRIMLVRSLGVFVGLPVLFYYYGFYGAVWGVALNHFIALPVQYMAMHRQGILSLFLELRAVPLVFIVYWLTEFFMSNTFFNFWELVKCQLLALL